MQVVFGLRAHPRALVVEAGAAVQVVVVAVRVLLRLRAVEVVRHLWVEEEPAAVAAAEVAYLLQAAARLQATVPEETQELRAEINRRLVYSVAWDWGAILRTLRRAMFQSLADPRPGVLALRHRGRVAGRAPVV